MENTVFGIHPILECILGNKRPDKVLIRKGLQGTAFQKLFSVIRKEKIPFQMVPEERLNKITRSNHQGVIAFLPAIEYQNMDELLQGIVEKGEDPVLVLLDGVTDVRNLGAIARSAECAGAHALVLPGKGSATITADAIKASAGALSRLAVCREPSIVQAVAFLKAAGIKVLACDDRGPVNLYDENLACPLAVIMGSENKGVSAASRKLADASIAIPMQGTIASLNVSVATGVVLFEALRQRRHAS